MVRCRDCATVSFSPDSVPDGSDCAVTQVGQEPGKKTEGRQNFPEAAKVLPDGKNSSRAQQQLALAQIAHSAQFLGKAWMLLANAFGRAALERRERQFFNTVLNQQVLDEAVAESADSVVEHQVLGQAFPHGSKVTTPNSLTSLSGLAVCGALFVLACSDVRNPCLETRRAPLLGEPGECGPRRVSEQQWRGLFCREVPAPRGPVVLRQ